MKTENFDILYEDIKNPNQKKTECFDDLLASSVYRESSDDSYAQLKRTDKDLIAFIEDRQASASKIATSASRKAGNARLTAKHFKAKNPVYARILKMVKRGDDLQQLKVEYSKTLSSLRKNVRQPMKFQELTGKLEVLGEILIESHLM